MTLAGIMTKAKKTIKIVAMLYLGLWLITALIGLPCVNRSFDREHSEGYSTLGQTDPEAVTRISNLSNVEELLADGNEELIPQHPFRYRSRGLAVAPFVIIDEVAWITAPMGGGAGKRIVIWFFGFQYWRPIDWYWSV